MAVSLEALLASMSDPEEVDLCLVTQSLLGLSHEDGHKLHDLILEAFTEGVLSQPGGSMKQPLVLNDILLSIWLAGVEMGVTAERMRHAETQIGNFNEEVGDEPEGG